MRIKLFVVFVLSCSSLLAQQVDKVSFVETSFDFGVIQEEDGPVTHEFKFTNNGNEPITITNVKASCGCTTPGWSKEPVLPGESGFIQAQYNPRNRPGKFNKTLTITTNLEESIRLYIRGEVTPRKKSPEEELLAEIGALRMKSTSLNMGKVYINREAVTRSFEIYNQSDRPISIKDNIQTPKHINVTFDQLQLAPKSKTNLTISYNAGIKDDLGFMNDNVTFYTDEAGDLSAKSLNIYATIEEYFGPMTSEQLAEAPQLKVEKIMHDFGRVKAGSLSEIEIEITNDGASDLLIRKLNPNCTCLEGDIKHKKIKPGGKSRLTLSFNATDRVGNQQKSLTIYSNDPRSSAKRLTIKAYVED